MNCTRNAKKKRTRKWRKYQGVEEEENKKDDDDEYQRKEKE